MSHNTSGKVPTRLVAVLLAVFLVGVGVFGQAPNRAEAANNDKISIYMDAPFVQGSYVTGAGVTREDFNSLPTGTCPSSISVGAVTGLCDIQTYSFYGGASAAATSSTPTVTAAGTNYATTLSNTNGMTITLSNPSRYVGFWWSAGGTVDTVKFYSGNKVVATMTTAEIKQKLGSFTLPYPGPGQITAIDGTTTYQQGYYYGNPNGHQSLTPTFPTNQGTTEPYAYLHFFASGSLTFNKIELLSAALEFDNLVVATGAQTPASTLVYVQEVLGNHEVTFEKNNGTGTTMPKQLASSTTALSANTYTRNGHQFIGWNTNPDGVSGTSYAPGADYHFESDMTLYARWRPVWAITYDTQGGTGVSDDVYGAGDTVALPAAPTKTGYTFDGWFLASAGGSDLGSSHAPSGTGALTLYAQWTPIAYAIEYDTQGGSAVADGSYTIGGTITLPNAPTRPGYSFDGWFVADSGGSGLGSSYTPSGTGALTLYAQWTALSSSPSPSSSSSAQGLSLTGNSIAMVGVLAGVLFTVGAGGVTISAVLARRRSARQNGN